MDEPTSTYTFGLTDHHAWTDVRPWGYYTCDRDRFEAWMRESRTRRLARYLEVNDGHTRRFRELPDFVQATMCGEWGAP